MRRRHTLLATVLAAAVAVTGAACGGGGGGYDASAPTTTADTGIAPASGVATEISAAPALASLGVPGAPDAAAADRTLTGLDAFGAPRDVFEPGVREASGGGSGSGGGGSAAGGAGSGAGGGTTTIADTTLTVPQVPVTPTPSPATTPVAPATPAPVPVTTPPTTTPAPAAPVTGPERSTSGWTRTDPAIIPTPDTRAGRTRLRADIEIDGVVVSAREGDAIPPSTQRYTVLSLSATEAVLRLDGLVLPDGGDVVTLTLGKEVALQNAVTGATETVVLVGIRAE